MVMTDSVEAMLLYGVRRREQRQKQEFSDGGLRQNTGEGDADIVVGGRGGVVAGADSGRVQAARGIVEQRDQIVEGGTNGRSVSSVVADHDHYGKSMSIRSVTV